MYIEGAKLISLTGSAPQHAAGDIQVQNPELE